MAPKSDVPYQRERSEGLTYESHGAHLLREYATAHPESVIWSPEAGWSAG